MTRSTPTNLPSENSCLRRSARAPTRQYDRDDQGRRTTRRRSAGPDPERDRAKTAGYLLENNISLTTVSSDWGHDITIKAIEGLIIFLIVVTIYISIRYPVANGRGRHRRPAPRSAASPPACTRSSGSRSRRPRSSALLTILGFSLYDTVVVYDKVAENSKDLLAGSRMTYSEAANHGRQPDSDALDQHVADRAAARRGSAVRRRPDCSASGPSRTSH